TSPKEMACRNEKVLFSASGNGTQTYKWSNGMSVATFTLLALSTQPFQFTVTATDQNGCTATDAITVTVSNCPGFAELGASAGLNIYPNPSTGDFTIESTEVLDMVILNELGQVVKEIPAAQGKISVIGLPAGLYFIQAEG